MSYTLSFEYEDSATYGMRVISGLLKYDEKALHIEYQAKDAIMGLVKGDVNDLHIPIEKVKAVELKKKFFSRRLIIKFDSLRTIDSMPGVNGNVLEVKVQKEEFNAAQNLTSAINLKISEMRLDQLKNDL